MNNIIECERCSLQNNQCPVLNNVMSADVMWVGLSAKKAKNSIPELPLSDSTNTGKILSEIEGNNPNLKYYRTNLVKCPPLKDGKLRYPTVEEMTACMPNLINEISTITPKIIFILGNHAEKGFNKYLQDNKITISIPVYKIQHPSYIYIYKRKSIDEYVNNVLYLISKVL